MTVATAGQPTSHGERPASEADAKSLRMTDWTYTDTTMLPLAEGMENLAAMAATTKPSEFSPSPSPRKFGQKGVGVSKAVLSENDSEAAEVTVFRGERSKENGIVQTCPTAVLVPGEGLEPTRL